MHKFLVYSNIDLRLVCIFSSPITHSGDFVFGCESFSRNSSDIFIALHVKVTSDEHGDKSFKV